MSITPFLLISIQHLSYHLSKIYIAILAIHHLVAPSRNVEILMVPHRVLVWHLILALHRIVVQNVQSILSAPATKHASTRNVVILVQVLAVSMRNAMSSTIPQCAPVPIKKPVIHSRIVILSLPHVSELLTFCFLLFC